MTVITKFYRTKTIIECIEIVGETEKSCIESFENEDLIYQSASWYETELVSLEYDIEPEVEEIDESSFSFPNE